MTDEYITAVPKKQPPKTAMLRRRADKNPFADRVASYRLSGDKAEICRGRAKKSAKTPFFSANDE